jgi:hypothetical protein
VSKTLQSQSQEQQSLQRRTVTSKSKVARVCERCFARNEAGETFCKVCGEQLPESLADVDSDGTRRLVPAAARALLIIELGKDVALVGRSSPADGVEPDVDLGHVDPNRLVSRRHAFILRRRGGFAIEDLESVNGTYLNGIQRLQPHAQTLLRDGDQVSFGETRAIFWTEAATGVTAQSPGLKVGH